MPLRVPDRYKQRREVFSSLVGEYRPTNPLVPEKPERYVACVFDETVNGYWTLHNFDRLRAIEVWAEEQPASSNIDRVVDLADGKDVPFVSRRIWEVRFQ